MQVGEIEPVRQQEVAVEAHEGAGVDGQGGKPGDGGQHEGQPAQGAVRQEGPGQGGPGGDDALGDDAGAAHGQALAPIGEFPGLVHIGVGHRPHHQESHAHGRHPAAVAARREAVAQLVQNLDQPKGQGIAGGPLPAQGIDQGGGKALPLAEHLHQAHSQGQAGEAEETGTIKELHPGQEALQPGVRPHQGQAEKEVVVQQPLGEAVPGGSLPLQQARRVLGTVAAA